MVDLHHRREGVPTYPTISARNVRLWDECVNGWTNVTVSRQPGQRLAADNGITVSSNYCRAADFTRAFMVRRHVLCLLTAPLSLPDNPREQAK